MIDSNAFRAKLVKIMPGYHWTVHRAGKDAKVITATGTQSSGFNRLSTLHVSVTEKNGCEWYTAKSAGFGLRAPWLHENGDSTLARALRGLQSHYQSMAATYAGHARSLENARKPGVPA